MVLIYITLLLFILYSILILYIWYAWKMIPEFYLKPSNSETSISVIIPARNEAGNIEKLLHSLKNQTYPSHLIDIIVIDDHSTDNTAQLVKEFNNVKLIPLGNELLNSYKKKAIELGIENATGDLIVTTDADCIVPDTWLETIVSFKNEKNARMIVAPVSFTSNHSLLENFQVLDFMVLQGITGAAVHNKMLNMCNGANLAYEKKLFFQVNGFAGIDNIASGDDMLLMQKIAEFDNSGIHYLKSKEVIVSTQPTKSWSEFFQQRIRWASKAMYYRSLKMKLILLLVYFFNLSFPTLLIAGFWNNQYWIFFLILWLAKTIVEYPLISSLAVFFNKASITFLSIFFQPIHIVYTLTAGAFSQAGTYQWKGRKVK